jgi:hypothetical protein
MAISTTLAVNVSASLTYSGNTLAAGLKSSTQTCGTTGGLAFQDNPVLTATAFKSYTTLGSLTVSTPFVLYVENLSTAGDYLLLPYDATLTQNAAGLAWLTSTAYTVGQVVTNDGLYYKCSTAHTSHTFFNTDLGNYKWRRLVACAPTIHADGLAWITSKSYALGNIVSHGGFYYECIVATSSGTLVPPEDAEHFSQISATVIPMGRAAAMWTTGTFSLVATTTPTTGECRVVAIQDA